MRLEEYLKKNNISVLEFASELGCSANTVHYWIRGAFKPSRIYAKMIQKITKSQVTVQELRGGKK